MAEGSSKTEDQVPAPPAPAGPDWFSRKAGEHMPGLSGLTSAYLTGIPEHLRTQATLILNELDSLRIRSISADTEMAMINAIAEEGRSHEIHKKLCSIIGGINQIWSKLLHFIDTTTVNTVYVAEPGSPGTPEAVAMEARLMEAIRKNGLKTNGITYYKKDEAGQQFAWSGSGSPECGDGEWIPQVYKKWTPKS